MVAITEEQNEEILIKYLDALECCNWNQLKDLYAPSARIESNLLPQVVEVNEYLTFWHLFINHQHKLYLRLVENQAHDYSFRFLLISYSSTFRKMVYLDIHTTVIIKEGKIINQYDKARITPFLAHLLSPFEFILSLTPFYKRKIKRRIYSMLESTSFKKNSACFN